MDAYKPSFSLKLTTEKLTKDEIKSFYQLVKKLAPNGVITDVAVPGENGELASALLISKPSQNGMVYEIPLVRYISDDEIEPIANAWCDVVDYDFEMESLPPN